MHDADLLPRVFQANVDRFYQRVILTTLAALPMHDTLAAGEEAASMREFLSRCAAQVDNHTANEAAKAFALTLDGMFERQLSRWLGTHGAKYERLDSALGTAGAIASIDLAKAGIPDDLGELRLVANVVRHGDGPSCDRLKAKAPQLWDNARDDYRDLAPAPVPASDELRIRAGDLRRYVCAIARFWGHVDPLPGAVREPPY